MNRFIRKFSVASSLKSVGINNNNILRNLSIGEIYEIGLQIPVTDQSIRATAITSTGALAAYSGAKTGRTPTDKRIVDNEVSKDIWWGKVNIKLDELSWNINRNRATDYLNTRRRLYVQDGYAGWDPKYRLKVRVISCRSYHALFMQNMLIRPTEEELKRDFSNGADYTIFNAGEFPANSLTKGMTSNTSVDLNLSTKEMVILGTQYAGEMKKGIFTIMHHLMPLKGVLSLHSSANEGVKGDVTILFGLSGTGKTTLSADPKRRLIGDDEHCWSDDGVYNIEGGCYAKCVNLTREKEPDIWDAIKFGTVLENVILDPNSRVVDFNDTTITENTRASYPLEYIKGVKIPAMAGHPKNIIFLTCDAFGVLPPVSKLTPEQAMYHFISGYTAKVAGTEVGIKEPTATFSACFGEAFLVHHPLLYAEMLMQKMRKHNTTAWLVNTGWVKGSASTGGYRMPLRDTRLIIDAIHNGELEKSKMQTLPLFDLNVPSTCTGVASDLLWPEWKGKEAEYQKNLEKLHSMFINNFKRFENSN
jgi:phosphoenolpyruvate carboxykinase (ATP)